MRRALAVGLVCAAAAAATGSSAPARNVLGTAKGERLVGTARADVIVARPGRDRVVARAGDDRVAVEGDYVRDTVACGRGRDLVTADLVDLVARDCETVTRVVSRDRYQNPESQHETQVEPDSAAFGSRVVATFQTGRRFDGGASDIAFATSANGGRTWRGGSLPGVGVFSSPAGAAARVSDPVVAYDAAHRVWLINTLGVSPGITELLISRSTNGLVWSLPVSAARAATRELAYDKNWLECDNGARSPFRGRCYMIYTDHRTSRPRVVSQVSTDGGQTWSAPLVAATGDVNAVGVLPVVRPTGELVVPYLGDDEMNVVLSRDGGATFTGPIVIAPVSSRRVPEVRSFPLPAANVDAAGNVYVVWHDCRLQPSCRVNDIVLSRSVDGVTWSRPVRVPTSPAAAPRSHFIPAIAVAPGTGGAGARIGIAYHWAAADVCDGAACELDVGFVESRNGGTTWGTPRRLSARSMSQSWLPRTSSGRMLADYIAVSYANARPVVIFALASEPEGGKLRQAIAATRLG